MRYQQSPSQITVAHTISRSRTLRWVLLASCLLALALAGPAHPVAAQFGGLSATLTASPSSASTGQVVSFNYSASPPAVAPPFASITSISINYGDGSSDNGNTGLPGQTVSGATTHVYTSPGTYTAFLTASASNGTSGSATATVVVGGGGGGGAPSVTVTAFPPTASVGQPVSFNYSATTSFGIGFPSIKSMLINYGDGAPLPLSPPSGTVSHTYNSPGVYNILVTAVDTNNQLGQATATVQIGGGSQFGQPPINVLIVNPPFAVTVGQPVSFTAATAQAVNPGAFIQSYVWNYSDGGSDFGQNVTHVFSSQGTFTVTLTVTDSTGASAQNSTTVSVSSGAPPPAPGVSVTYQSGWNIVAAPTGTSIAGALLPLFTFQNGDTAYRMASTTTAGMGYWAFFNSPSTVTIPFTGPQTITRALQPSQFVMIGNSSSSQATVTGADVVFTYNANTGYQQSTTLQPGQGAWALSYSGANVTITSTGR